MQIVLQFRTELSIMKILFISYIRYSDSFFFVSVSIHQLFLQRGADCLFKGKLNCLGCGSKFPRKGSLAWSYGHL